MPLGSNLTPPRGSQFYIELYKEKFKRHLLFNPRWKNNGRELFLDGKSMGGNYSKLLKITGGENPAREKPVIP